MALLLELAQAAAGLISSEMLMASVGRLVFSTLRGAQGLRRPLMGSIEASALYEVSQN